MSNQKINFGFIPDPPKNPRQIIQIATSGIWDPEREDYRHTTTALCRDGTVWQLGRSDKQATQYPPVWMQLPPIPQS